MRISERYETQNLTRRDMLVYSAWGLAGLTLATSCAPFTAGKPKATAATVPWLKIGVVDWELGLRNDLKAVEVAAQLGYDGLQMDLGVVEHMVQPEKQKEYLDKAASLGIEIGSLALGILNRVPYKDKNEPKAQEYVDLGIDITQAMGLKVILLAFFGKGQIRDFKTEEIDVVVERLKEIAPKAEQAGVELGVEAHIDVDQYMEILDRVGSPAVKVYFDLVHAHRLNRDVYQEITFLGDRICEFHAKDLGNLMLGEGDLDFKEVRRGMEAIGYKGWMHAEQWNEIKGDKPISREEAYRRNLAYLRAVFAG